MSVQYNVSGLVRESVGSTRSYDVDADVLIYERERGHQHVAGRATLLRTNDGVLVTAHLRGAHRDRCSRCLRDIDIELEMDVEEEFFQTVDPRTGAALPPPEELESFRIDAEHTLDMDEAIRQSWTVAVPMQPLCRADCRGLCPSCGTELNEGACTCRKEADDRWAALRQLVGEREG